MGLREVVVVSSVQMEGVVLVGVGRWLLKVVVLEVVHRPAA